MTNKPGKTFDLADLNTSAACDKAVEIELKHPATREGLGMFISVFGRDSKVFKEKETARHNADIRRAFAAEKKGRVADPKTAEEIKAEGTDLLVACTAGFRGLIMGGKELVFSPAVATELYTSHPWIREQVDSAVVDLELFIKG
jgi:hypothetical protein